MRRHNNDNKMSTGRVWAGVLARVISHLTIVLSCVLGVIFISDAVGRGDMGLLTNSMTRDMLFALCILAVSGSVLNLAAQRRLRALRKYFRITSRREK